MGYNKIPNLYQDNQILVLFKRVICGEKIHGTSAHVAWKDGELRFFAGGEKHANFIKLFDEEKLRKTFTEEFGTFTEVIIHGEAYGGKCQKMSHVYGPDLKFIAFEAKVDGHWLSVTNAHNVATKLGLEFVHYVEGPATLDFVNEQRDAPSVQAQRNGMGDDKPREGVVIRPLIELVKNNGERIMAKHKGESFRETKTPRKVVNPEKLKVLEDAQAVAEEWVTAMRLFHVADKLKVDGEELTVKDTGRVIRAMIEDIRIEGAAEIKWSKPVSAAIGKAVSSLFHKYISKLEG